MPLILYEFWGDKKWAPPAPINFFLNLTDENLILVLCWLVNSFRPDYPFPILLLSGEQGTAKSTSSRVLRSLIDPSTIPVRSAPRDERDLILAANNGWVVGLDNLSTIPEWLSDALCRFSTGGGFGTRTLYSDDEETIFTAKRPIIVNGIGDIASRSDLLDRALTVRLEPIPKSKRRTENEFWKAFGRDLQEIFVGLLNAVSMALSNVDTVALDELPRMADFAKFATAAEPGLGLPNGSFLNVYTRNRQDIHSIVLEDSPLAETVQEYCVARASDGGFVTESILLKDLLNELKGIAGERFSNDKGFPKTPKGLRNGLERVNPNLREIGICIMFHGRVGRNAAKGASLSIEYKRQETSQTSEIQPPKASPGNLGLPDDVEVLREIGLRQWNSALDDDANGNRYNDLCHVSELDDVSDVSFRDDSPW